MRSYHRRIVVAVAVVVCVAVAVAVAVVVVVAVRAAVVVGVVAGVCMTSKESISRFLVDLENFAEGMRHLSAGSLQGNQLYGCADILDKMIGDFRAENADTKRALQPVSLEKVPGEDAYEVRICK